SSASSSGPRSRSHASACATGSFAMARSLSAGDGLDETLVQRLLAHLREEDGHERPALRDHLALAEVGVLDERARAGRAAQTAIAAAARRRRLLAEVRRQDPHAAHGRLAVALH